MDVPSANPLSLGVLFRYYDAKAVVLCKARYTCINVQLKENTRSQNLLKHLILRVWLPESAHIFQFIITVVIRNPDWLIC